MCDNHTNATSMVEFEGPAGVGSDIIKVIVGAVGSPTGATFMADLSYYVEFDTPNLSAQVHSTMISEDRWGAAVYWSVREESPRVAELVEYLEEL